MLARRGLLVGALMLGMGTTLLLACCGGRRETVRYKMTIEVETPEGLKSGVAVREVTYTRGGTGPSILGGGGSVKVRGEAVAIDLPGDQALFALLTGADGDVDYGSRVFDRATGWLPAYAGGNPKSMTSKKPIELYPAAPDTIGLKNTNPLPLLVRFGDLSDSTSVAEVEADDLAASFGPGVKLKRITIVQTDEPVTVGIGKRLGWLGKHPEPSLNPDHGPKDFSISATTHHGDFREGTEQ